MVTYGADAGALATNDNPSGCLDNLGLWWTDKAAQARSDRVRRELLEVQALSVGSRRRGLGAQEPRHCAHSKLRTPGCGETGPGPRRRRHPRLCHALPQKPRHETRIRQIHPTTRRRVGIRGGRKRKSPAHGSSLSRGEANTGRSGRPSATWSRSAAAASRKYPGP